MAGKHFIRWFVYARQADGSNKKIRHSRHMRGQWGYDVECTCGWKTTTGGATRGYIQGEVDFHKWQVAA